MVTVEQWVACGRNRARFTGAAKVNNAKTGIDGGSGEFNTSSMIADKKNP